MIWQRARELGALPDRLVHPGEAFEWHILEPWADELTASEVKAYRAQLVSEPEPAQERGISVTPGSSEVVTGPRRRGRPKQAVTE